MNLTIVIVFNFLSYILNRVEIHISILVANFDNINIKQC